jgi:hypothetical protein
MSKKPTIVRRAIRQLDMIFVGMAVPHQPKLADGVYGPIKSEKIFKFSRKHMRPKAETIKADPRYRGGDDMMIDPVGKPGSSERVVALAERYAILSLTESSAFAE